MTATLPALATLPPKCRIGFPFASHPLAVIADLALQLSGRCAVPMAAQLGDLELGAEAARLELGGWLDLPAELADPRAPVLSLPGAAIPEGLEQSEATSRAPAPSELGITGDEPEGGSVLLGESEEAPRQASLDRIAVAATRLDAELGQAPPRDHVVLATPPTGSPSRLLLAWATLTGAAVVLPPAGGYGGVLFWARPTVVAESPSCLAALRQELLSRAGGSEPNRRLARRLSRLRALVVVGGELEHEEADAWSRLGPRIVAAPLL